MINHKIILVDNTLLINGETIEKPYFSIYGNCGSGRR